jgi:3-hydroxyisobutyrate dehydrogenase
MNADTTDNRTIKTIGFIGLGNMGRPMATNLVRAGYAVIAHDLIDERARAFAADHDAVATQDLGWLGARADAVITMLPSGREVRHALLKAQDGALAAKLRPGSIVIDMSSADPVGTRALGAELAARGIALVDAPVSGGVTRARDATLTIMIGGSAEAIDTVRPVLKCVGKNLFEVGRLGCGHAMKALNNVLAGTSLAAAVEALMVGERFGLDPSVMTDVLNLSTGRSFATESLLKQHVISRAYGTGFALGLLAKDVDIAVQLAEEIGAETPILRLVGQIWREACDVVGSEKDHTRAAAYWQERRLRGSQRT